METINLIETIIQNEYIHQKNVEWKDSKFEKILHICNNDRGKVGETVIKELCKRCKISSNICGLKMKRKGGGCGDGTIMTRTIEIKTSYKDRSGKFQHELGEKPWKAEFLLFIDIAPECVYLTILHNFNRKHYQNEEKFDPYFPTRKATWRKKSGAFKFDTNIKLNEENVKQGYCIKITEKSMLEIKKFIKRRINDDK